MFRQVISRVNSVSQVKSVGISSTIIKKYISTSIVQVASNFERSPHKITNSLQGSISTTELLKLNLNKLSELTLLSPLSKIDRKQEINEKVIERKDDGLGIKMELDSVIRKRRLKIKKHKLRKRRKAQRAMRRKLGK